MGILPRRGSLACSGIGCGACARSNRGSALLIVLGVLAMLAVMATSFVTLMRLDAKTTSNYVDDQRCEMLAMGAMSYFKGPLRDDLDRTWGKYENRDAAVGAVGYVGVAPWDGSVGISRNIPGMTELAYGTPVCNDFWFNAPVSDWTDWGALYAGEYGNYQLTFAARTGNSHCVPARMWDAANNREYDAWVSRTLTCWGRVGTDSEGMVVHQDHPNAGNPIDYDGDGAPRPTPNGNNGAFTGQEYSDTGYYFDTGIFVLYSGDSYYLPGPSLTREKISSSGLYWRFGAKLGVPHGMYLDLNAIGNLDGQDSSYLANIGRLQLEAQRSADETTSSFSGTSRHLGRLHWKGYSGEYDYARGGFPRFYNEVNYLPSQISAEKLFSRDKYSAVSYVTWDNGTDFNIGIDRQKARDILSYRMGPNEKPADGTDRYRPGWRPDGATYYKLTPPENPLGDDRYLGANEVIEHDHASYNPATSVMATELAQGEWRRLRPYVTMWSADTILRGKIWPTEGPLPWRTGAQQGDWKHLDILKRVNINIIGARGPDGLSQEDSALKTKWAQKRQREQDRLYFMLLAGMRQSNVPSSDVERQRQACQFIASLTDAVDRDQSETCYRSPDSLSGEWGLGVEKFPVFNEIALYVEKANSKDYTLSYLRLELYDPMENIPWIPDADEAIDISDYWLRVNQHAYSLSSLRRFAPDSFTVADIGAITTIGASGMYGIPVPGWNRWTPDPQHATWNRYLHIGWPLPTKIPGDITRQEAIDGLNFELWKPLRDPVASANVPLNPGKVEMIGGVKCICVDKTPPLKMMPPFDARYDGPGTARSTSTYLGLYRRWDATNARVLQPEGTNEQSELVWLPGWDPGTYANLGHPNIDYPLNGTTVVRGNWNNTSLSPYRYYRHYERNLKVVDGDLPSIGWLGELLTWNVARNGPLTWVHDSAQAPIQGYGGANSYEGSHGSSPTTRGWKNQIDTRAKFDLFRPFGGVTAWPAEGEWDPNSATCRTENLQMLDIFTVWDPSNDGIDNDGDGAVDDEDTGLQPGDKCGPEVRVFGRIDLNVVTRRASSVVFPDNQWVTGAVDLSSGFCKNVRYGVTTERRASGSGGRGCWGAMETIGDVLRADCITIRPGGWFAGSTDLWQDGPIVFREGGFADFSSNPWGMATDPATWQGDDDGDGIFDERDERDMLFTWVSNYLTTRSNVFEIDLMVTVSDPPHYPGFYASSGTRQLPFPAYKVRRPFARKQVIAILDRSGCLRVRPDKTCDFSGPVDVRMLRFTEDRRAY